MMMKNRHYKFRYTEKLRHITERSQRLPFIFFQLLDFLVVYCRNVDKSGQPAIRSNTLDVENVRHEWSECESV